MPGTYLYEVDFRLRWLLVVLILWWMPVFEVEHDEGRIRIQGRLKDVAVFNRLEKEDGDDVVDGGAVACSPSLDNVRKVLPPRSHRSFVCRSNREFLSYSFERFFTERTFFRTSHSHLTALLHLSSTTSDASSQLGASRPARWLVVCDAGG